MNRARLMASVTACWLAAEQPVLRPRTTLPCRLARLRRKLTLLPRRKQAMPSLQVVPVQSRREKKQFFQLPWDLYRGDPNWIPPLRANQWAMLGYSHHPFYDDAEAQTFLALKD